MRNLDIAYTELLTDDAFQISLITFHNHFSIIQCSKWTGTYLNDIPVRNISFCIRSSWIKLQF